VPLRLSILICSLLCSAALFAADLTAHNQTGNYDFSIVHRTAQELSRLHSLIIRHEGVVVFEEYYNGTNPNRPANMKSASKSVISALVGIAIDQGLIESVEQRVADYFPELDSNGSNSEKSNITIENLLTMQSGLETTSNRNYGKWVLSDNWVEFALNQPLVAKPGTQMIYSTGSTHLLSAILAKASGMTTKQFAERMLTSELGYSMSYWPQDPQGIYFGGNDMEMTPRQMLRFGTLYLNDGRYNDRQIVSQNWIEQSYKPHALSPRGQGRHYGYGWWLRDLAGMQVPVAWGYGGQLIFVVKELDLVVVATSQSTPGPQRRGHLGRLYDLVEEFVFLPIIAEDTIVAGD